MVRQVAIFFILWMLAFAGISTWRRWTFKESIKWGKTLIMSGLAALVVSVILAVIVILF